MSLNSFYRCRQKLAAEDRVSTQEVRAKGGLAREQQATLDESRRPLATKVLMSSEPMFVQLTVLTSPAVEISLPCGAVVRVPNDDRSLRRMISILMECRSAHESVSGAPPPVPVESCECTLTLALTWVPEPWFLSSLQDETFCIQSPVVRLSATNGYSLTSFPDEPQRIRPAMPAHFISRRTRKES